MASLKTEEQAKRERTTRGARQLQWLLLPVLVSLAMVACQESVAGPAGAGEEAASEVTTPQPSGTPTARPIQVPSRTPLPGPTGAGLAGKVTATLILSTLPAPSATARATTTPSPTPTPLPTFTPAAVDASDRYRLEVWTPAQASALIARLEAYPDSLTEEERGYNNRRYYEAFAPATLALEEALVRFPEDPAATRWRWQLAYDYVRSGDVRAASLYASLMEAALASGESTTRTLPLWFSDHEKRLVLSAVRDSAAPTLLQLAVTNDEGEEESGTYFIVEEKRGATRVYPLAYDDAFDLAHGAGLWARLADVTGDGEDELIAVHAHQPGGSSAFYYTDLLVYDLTVTPPQQLSFSPALNTHLGWGDEDGWAVVDVRGTPRLQLRELPSERCEAVAVVSVYGWTGERLQRLENGYKIRESAGSRYCLPFVFAAAEAGQEEALQYLEEGIYRGGPEQADEWRYRLGLYHALAGDVAAATGYLEDLVAEPAGSGGTWARAARRFLNDYEMPAGLYPACRTADLCNPKQALRLLVAQQPPDAFALTAEALRRWGVPVTRWGYFDMEGDGTLEQWLLVEAGGVYEFWIVVPGEEQLEALFVDVIAGNAYASELSRLGRAGGIPVVQVDNGRERLLFTYVDDPDGRTKPVITTLRSESVNESDNYTAQLLANSKASLWQGGDRALVADTLSRFSETADFNCTLGTLDTICPEYRYVVALALELAGNAQGASDNYLAVWRQYPDTPYAIMARARVAPILAPTATPTS